MTKQEVLNKLDRRSVLILQGIPGAGKSSFIDDLEQHLNSPDPNTLAVVSSDHFFVRPEDGEYEFNEHLLGQAHASCRENFEYFIDLQGNRRPLFIVIDNTNTTRKEMTPYIKKAKESGWDVTIITFKVSPEVSIARNIHRVPKETIDRMNKQLETFTAPEGCARYIVDQEV
jgi:predicted kinase